jgi:hypothetical protein
MAGRRRFFSLKVSRGGTYSLCHLAATALAAIVVSRDGARPFMGPLAILVLVLRFPMEDGFTLLTYHGPGSPSGTTPFFMGLCFVTMNSFLCGYSLAYLQGRIQRWRKAQKQRTEGETALGKIPGDYEAKFAAQPPDPARHDDKVTRKNEMTQVKPK